VVAHKFGELFFHGARLHPPTQPAQGPLRVIYPSLGNQPYRGLWHLRGAQYCSFLRGLKISVTVYQSTQSVLLKNEFVACLSFLSKPSPDLL
jgi:hypothetical protein